MSRLGKFAISAVLVLLGCWFYATPYIAIHGAQKAAKQGDAAALSGYVDFPALKASLKTNLTLSMAVQNQANPADPMQAIGIAFASALIDPLVEVMVTPQNLALIFQGKSPSLEKRSQSSDSSNPTVESGGGDVITKAGYESYDRFVVHINHEMGGKQLFVLVLHRDGLTTWKLVGIRFPIESGVIADAQSPKT